MKRRKFYALGRSRFCYYFAKYASLMDLLAFFGGWDPQKKLWEHLLQLSMNLPVHLEKISQTLGKNGGNPLEKKGNISNIQKKKQKQQLSHKTQRFQHFNPSPNPPKKTDYIIRTIEQISLNLCPPKKTRNQSGQLPILSPHPRIYSLKLTAKTPENGCLEDALFSGAIFVSFR